MQAKAKQARRYSIHFRYTYAALMLRLVLTLRQLLPFHEDHTEHPAPDYQGLSHFLGHSGAMHPDSVDGESAVARLTVH